MCPGLSADLQQMDDSRKTAIINEELTRLNIDVACLQPVSCSPLQKRRLEAVKDSSPSA